MNIVKTKNYTLYNSNCLGVLKTLPDNFVDSIVTDPPAGIGFMNKSWDSNKGGRDNWISWMTEIASECLRILKPGGYVLVWAIPKTSHWTATAWENAGFEIRDRIIHCFGSGFPKNLDIGKQIEKKFGKNEEENYNGIGTALKPAVEDWWLCRKSVEGTIVENVLKYGTGGINIDDCRISNQDSLSGEIVSKGRFPANFIHDGSDEILEMFPETKSGKSNGNAKIGEGGNIIPLRRGTLIPRNDDGSASRFFYCAKASKKDREEGLENFIESDSTIQNTSGRRFNPICNNTGKRIQNCSCGNCDWSKDTNPKRKNVHPTVKPVELMKYLCRLITPPGGIILDPFMGSGSTGKAAILENFNFIGVENESEYFEIANARIQYVNKTLLKFLEN